MVQLDDFDGLEKGGSVFREVHGQNGANGEVGGDQDADTAMVHQLGPEPVELRVSEAGRPHDGMDVVVDAPLQVVEHRVRMGEIDDDLGGLGRRAVIAEIDGRNQSKSGADSTVRQTSAPILPRDPNTPTLITHRPPFRLPRR